MVARDAGGRHHLQRGGHQLRPRLGRQRAAAPRQLLRPGGGRARARCRAATAAPRTMVYGSSYDENSFQVDGVDITDNYFNEALAEPNMDAIEEVEILSLGAPAEYGNLTGAVYNIVTRQGTNEFHGDVGFYFQTDGSPQQHRGHREPRRQLPGRLPGRRRALPVDPRQVHGLHAPSSAGRSSRTSCGSSPPTRTSATTTGTWAWTTPTR